MSDIKIEIIERLPVYRKCSNCKGFGYLHIVIDDHASTDASLHQSTCSCYLCHGQGVIPTGDFAYQTPQGLVLEE